LENVIDITQEYDLVSISVSTLCIAEELYILLMTCPTLFSWILKHWFILLVDLV